MKRIIVGGKTNIPLWISLNADPSTNPDILADISNLSNIEDNSVSVFYMSHVFEHIPLSNVINTLSKINKAMTTNGTLFISVPDMSVLAMLLNKDALNLDQRIHIMRMIYGGQISKFDFHYFGYTFEILKSILNEVGFKLIRKVKYFNLHTDTSSFTPYYNLPISLNVICHK